MAQIQVLAQELPYAAGTAVKLKKEKKKKEIGPVKGRHLSIKSDQLYTK